MSRPEPDPSTRAHRGPPLPPPASDDELAVTWEVFRGAVHAVESEMAESLSFAGPVVETHGVLAALAEAPSGRLTMTELARSAGLSSGAMTKVVDRLADDGMVVRSRSPHDRRVVYAELTDAGADQGTRSSRLRAAALRGSLGGLGQPNLAALRSLCQRVGHRRPGSAAPGAAVHPPAHRGVIAEGDGT